ncbi:MAG: sensor histidine kinase [Clostridium sp.]
MNIKRYISSKSPFIIINLIVYSFFFTLMIIADTSISSLIVIFTIWFTPFLSYLIIDFINRKRFYDEVLGIVEGLDKKYLLPEIMKKPKSYEFKILHEILYETNRAMHENVNYYKNLQLEYKEFIETWVHEIKTPLASAKLIGENSEIRGKNNLISDLNMIDGFIDQALYYARSTNVNNDYIIKKFEISDVVKSVIRGNRRGFINSKIAVDIEACSGVVFTDSKWVEFILNQIVINSIKYTKENGVIKFSTENREDSLVLIIKDNGIGIDNKDINRVFEKGFTGENGRIYGKSTGIGLYLCRKLCNKLGLGISLTSIKGKGTSVKIIFPLGKLHLINK